MKAKPSSCASSCTSNVGVIRSNCRVNVALNVNILMSAYLQNEGKLIRKIIDHSVDAFVHSRPRSRRISTHLPIISPNT